MNDVRTIPQEPLRPLTTQLGELTTEARTLVGRLESVLKRLDAVRGTLREQEKVDVTIDLGEIGNAAATARRQLESVKNEPAKFRMPQPHNFEAAYQDEATATIGRRR